MFSRFGFTRSKAPNAASSPKTQKRNWTQFLTGMHPIHRAARFGKVDEIKRMLADPNFDPNVRTGSGKETDVTALMLAARTGKKDVAEVLVADPRTNVNLVYKIDSYNTGRTASEMAIEAGHPEVAAVIEMAKEQAPAAVGGRRRRRSKTRKAKRGTRRR